MRFVVVLVLAMVMCMEAECRRAAEQDFWSGSSVDPHPGAIQDMPGNEVMSAEPLDRIQVISSAIRVLPRPLKTRARRSPRPVSQEELKVHLQKHPTSKKQSSHSTKVTSNYNKNTKHEHSEHGKDVKRQKSISGHSFPRSQTRAHFARSLKVPPHHDENEHKDHKTLVGKRHNKKAVSSHGFAPDGHDLPRRHKKTEGVSSQYKTPSTRRFRRETINSFRRPRDFQFVTNKMDRLPPPPIVRVYPPGQRDEREIDRGYRKAQRRIIYYANLPEIVRPPVQWYPANDYFYDSSRQPYTSASSTIYSPSKTSYPSYPSPSENDITRVQSNIIDITNSRFPSYSTPPKFTIIDVDPPYYNRAPLRYDSPNRFYDIRTPPYRDYSHFPSQSFHPETPLEPVKLQTPPPDYSSNSNSTESTTNSTRFLPDVMPVNLRSLSKFIT